jgi:Pectate lyase superfamily protein
MSAPQLTAYVNGPIAVTGDQLNTFMQTADNAAQMRDQIGVSGLSIYARGMSALNDGQGGAFYWNSTSTGPDDNQSTIVPFGAKLGAWCRVFDFKGFYSVPTIAALRAATINTLAPPLVYVQGYYTGADGGEGMFWFNVTDTTSADNGGTIVVDSNGRRWYREEEGEIITVKQFGAKGDGVTDDAPPFRAAIATGKTVRAPAASYVINSAVTMTTPGQILMGDGRVRTVLLISTTFSGTGVIMFQSGEEGPQVRDLGIEFTQPDTSTRSALATYPPAILATNQPRFSLERVRIARATTCVSMGGNSGGASIFECEFSAFSQHVFIDGSVDTIRITNTHFWPFDLTANQQTIYYDIGTVGIESGRCDDLILTGCLWLCGLQLSFITSAAGTTFATITGCDFDSNYGILLTGGILSIAGCFFSTGLVAGTYQCIGVNVGKVQISGCNFEVGPNASQALVHVTSQDTANPTYVEISACTFDSAGLDIPHILVDSLGTGFVSTATVTGCQFRRAPDLTYTNATVAVDPGARLTIADCRHSDKGAGTGIFVQVIADDWHSITGNVGVNWPYSLPATHSILMFANNI